MATDASFCTGCGAPRDRSQAAGLPVPATEDRRRVSVLFIDLIGFTPYAEQADPELIRGLQTGFFATARKVIGQYGGVVEKYIGDAVMALFGAPVATETDAVRCVRAGLELQRELGRRSASPGLSGPRFRVGVATGEALVDIAAARDGGQAIVAGDVVTMASRLQSVAPAGGVLVCPNTYRATRTEIRYSQQPPVTLRGRSAPTEVWLAMAPLTRSHPDREPGASPLVNRTHELGLLVNALHRGLRERVPQMVTVLGHAGIGKSRLVRELYGHAQRLFDSPVVWRVGRCPPFGANVTYTALADIVKAQAGILDTDGADAARERLDAMLRDLVDEDEAARLAGALGPLVGLPGSKITADEAASAWRRFVAALAADRPTVLVFEDLHWADESMLRFVELLAASVRNVPLLLLCTSRPELLAREPMWAGGIGGSVTITLPPLRDEEIATMYAHLLGKATFPSDSLGPLIELADGNPLYAHEYTRMLVERGALRGLDLLPAGEASPLPMPDSVHAVIANRVDLLDASDRAVLQAASVVGMQFWAGAVAAAIGRPLDAVERSLRRLEQRELIEEQVTSTMAGQPEYRFGHVLVRDVCYQRLPRTERIARHERTANWLDGVSADRDTDLAGVLAHHRYTAFEIARALGLDATKYAEPARMALYRAARRAYALHALDTAAGLAGRALGLCDETTAATDRLRLELLSTEITFYTDDDAFLAGGGADQLTGLAERLDAVGDRACAARAWTLLGQAAWLRADRPGATECLGKAVERYDSLPDDPQKAEAYAELGRLHMLNCDDGPAISAAGIAAEIAERLGLAEVRANAQITVEIARYQEGDAAGITGLRNIVEQCRERRLLAHVRGNQNLAFVLREEGDWVGSEAAEDDVLPPVPGGHNLATGYSREAMRAYFAGDWARLVTAADAILATPSGEWDLQVGGLRAWITVLRDAVPADVPKDEVAALLAAGERSGFRRLRWTSLAHGALCRALLGRMDEAGDLLAELTAGWCEARVVVSGEWMPAAAHAAALAGRAAATTVDRMLSLSPRCTPWVRAAQETVLATAAEADGDHEAATRRHLAAAEIYRAIPNATERAMALASAARSLRGPDARADESAAVHESAESWCAELRAFAARNRAPGLLTLARLD